MPQLHLCLMRHGEALSKQEAKVGTDGERPLAPNGITAITQVARGLRAMGVKLDRVLTSPLLRARQTAELLAKGFDCADHVEVCQALSPEQEPIAFVEDLRERHAEGIILAIGHQPYLGRLTAQLVFGEPHDGVVLRPAGVCLIELPEFPRTLDATLCGLWHPELLAGLTPP